MQNLCNVNFMHIGNKKGGELLSILLKISNFVTKLFEPIAIT